MRFRRTSRSGRSGCDAGCDAANLVGKTAFRRLSKLESSQPLTVFTRETLLTTHAYLCGDVYPWAGTIRTGEVGAMGLAMCRATYVDQELDRLFRRIAVGNGSGGCAPHGGRTLGRINNHSPVP